MIRPFFFLLLTGIAIVNSTLAQSSRKWEPAITLESYVLERYDGPGLYLTADYAGQALSGRYAYNCGEHWQFGVSGGMYFHHRQGIGRSNDYLYLPVQGFVTYRTTSDRFQAEFSTGHPIKLKEYAGFVGQQGFWYKDISPSSAIYDIERNWVRHKMFLMSHLRLKFRVSNHLYFTTGVRHTFYSFYSLSSPDHIRTPRNYLNLSFGLEYHFGQQKKE